VRAGCVDHVLAPFLAALRPVEGVVPGVRPLDMPALPGPAWGLHQMSLKNVNVPAVARPAARHDQPVGDGDIAKSVLVLVHFEHKMIS
jgi:hypothetical protein